MDDMRLKYYTPIITGTPDPAKLQAHLQSQSEQPDSAQSFQSILGDKLKANSEIAFSKHAVKRAAENNIDLTLEKLQRLNQGVKMASEKNLDDTLILVGTTAFLVNVKNNTVITAVNSNDAKGNVFTNIDGTVIV